MNVEMRSIATDSGVPQVDKLFDEFSMSLHNYLDACRVAGKSPMDIEHCRFVVTRIQNGYAMNAKDFHMNLGVWLPLVGTGISCTLYRTTGWQQIGLIHGDNTAA